MNKDNYRIKKTIESERTMLKLYQNESEALTMLREGNWEERINAICSIYAKKENFDLFWEIFLSDEHWRVRSNALCACCHIKPEKLYEILEYVLEHDRENNIFTRIIAQKLLELHKKEN